MRKVFEHGGRLKTLPLLLMNAAGGVVCNAAVYMATSDFWNNWHSLLLVGAVSSATLMQSARVWQIEPFVVKEIWVEKEKVIVETQAERLEFNEGEAILSPENPVPNDFKYFKKVHVGEKWFYIGYTGEILDEELLKKAIGDFFPKPIDL